MPLTVPLGLDKGNESVKPCFGMIVSDHIWISEVHIFVDQTGLQTQATNSRTLTIFNLATGEKVLNNQHHRFE